MCHSVVVDGGNGHCIHPAFEQNFEAIKRHFFSRDPKYWPCFSDPGLAAIIAFRQRYLPPAERLATYPDGPKLHEVLTRDDAVPRRSTPPDGRPDELLMFAAALSKDWENPASVENVITMPCDPGIYGAMIGSLVNPNLVYSEYSGMADELSNVVIRQIAKLVGYNSDLATGIFTQGGTFCNLYGYLTGISKSLPDGSFARARARFGQYLSGRMGVTGLPRQRTSVYSVTSLAG